MKGRTTGDDLSRAAFDTLDQVLAADAARKHRRLTGQLRRAVESRRAVGDHEAAALAADWLRAAERGAA